MGKTDKQKANEKAKGDKKAQSRPIFLRKRRKPGVFPGFLDFVSIKTVNHGGTNQNRTGVKDFADLCLTSWLWCRVYLPAE